MHFQGSIIIALLLASGCASRVTERAESPTSKRAVDPALIGIAPHGSTCATNSDCQGGTTCTTSLPTKGGAQPMPAQPPSQCTTTADCAARELCILRAPGADKASADEDAANGEQPASTIPAKPGECRENGCYSDGDCPQYHRCDANYCRRMQCKANRDCGAGFCVNGQCGARSGSCVSMRIMQPA